MNYAPRQISSRLSLIFSAAGIFAGLGAVIISTAAGYVGMWALYWTIPMGLFGIFGIFSWGRLSDVTLETDTFVVRTWLNTEYLPAAQLTGYSRPSNPKVFMWDLSFGRKTIRFIEPGNPDQVEQILRQLLPPAIAPDAPTAPSP